MIQASIKHITITLAIVILSGCQSVYFNAMEKVGYHKRDIMVDRVENARDAQEEAKEEFASALDQFQSMFGKENSDLQDQYDLLSDAFEDSEEAAQNVTKRIDSVESVSEALFEEWESELEQYTSTKLRQDSKKKLLATRRQYEALVKAMRRAEGRMEPVLNAFRDQVLYLKHNLNARAINGLRTELKTVESDVARLIKDMEVSISEAQSFIAQLEP